ncbi:retrovirus-related Pol polyprotein from transposon 412 [Trichonephila clavipes]|nr:retrovirus-related Pol polyprotein from transposon 412 [Trichonephila clavipes]
MKTRYDTKATGHQFKEGDKVWFYNPTRRKGLSPKLQSHWDGPYTILKIINDVVIRIPSAKLATDLAPNVGDKLGDHGNPAPNNPVWQPYRGIVTLCIELFSYAPDFLDLSISRLFWQVQEVSDRKV